MRGEEDGEVEIVEDEEMVGVMVGESLTFAVTVVEESPVCDQVIPLIEFVENCDIVVETLGEKEVVTVVECVPEGVKITELLGVTVENKLLCVAMPLVVIDTVEEAEFDGD